MELVVERGRRISVEELNTTRLLAHARNRPSSASSMTSSSSICDAHHYENENYGEILPFMENDVLRQVTIGGRAKGRRSIVPEPSRVLRRTWVAV